MLVTGHTGFKGSWLSLWLHRLGARVTGYALAPPTRPANFEVARIREVLAAHGEADIRDGARLVQALRETQPDVVFHLAAQSLVRGGYQSPVQTFDVNMMGTVGLLEAVRAVSRACVVVVVTTDKVYADPSSVWGHRECDALGGDDPYSASKAATELAVAAYRQSFFPPGRLGRHGVAVATVRAGNAIGGGDWSAGRVVVDAVRALAEGRAVPVRNPGSIRPWQHVLEPLDGYLHLAARMLRDPDPALCTAWNFGPRPGDEVTVLDLVRRLCEAWGAGTWEDASDPAQPHEAPCLRLSIDQAVARIGWRPRWSLDQAVERTARWYRRYYHPEADAPDMQSLCLEDITEYQRAPRGRS